MAQCSNKFEILRQHVLHILWNKKGIECSLFYYNLYCFLKKKSFYYFKLNNNDLLYLYDVLWNIKIYWQSDQMWKSLDLLFSVLWKSVDCNDEYQLYE